jgi:hypothetical protein
MTAKSSRKILPLFRASSWRIYLVSLCGLPYFQVCHWQGAAYSLARLGKLSRSINRIQAFSPEPDRGFPQMSDMSPQLCAMMSFISFAAV